MKKIALLASALCLTAGAQAAEVGFGASVGSYDTQSVYVPINITKEFRLEPYFSLYDYSDRQKGGVDSTNRYYNLGLGVFKIEPATDNVNVIIGGRVGYLESKYTNGANGESGRGYSIAPVIGFEYFPVKDISVGADVSLQYSNVGYNGRGANLDDRSTSTTTVTNVTFKYYFN